MPMTWGWFMGQVPIASWAFLCSAPGGAVAAESLHHGGVSLGVADEVPHPLDDAAEVPRRADDAWCRSSPPLKAG